MNENKEANEYGVSQYGRWLIQLRNGEKPRLNQTNNYLFEAVRLTGLLYTLPEIKKEYPNIFEIDNTNLTIEQKNDKIKEILLSIGGLGDFNV